MKVLRFYFILFLVLFFLVSTVNSAEYYVATTGNDNNPGTINSPFRTIQQGANVAQAGDIVYVRSGIYTENSAQYEAPFWGRIGLKIKNSGTLNDYITFQSYPGEVAVIDQQDTYEGIMIASDYIRIKDFEIRNVFTNFEDPSGGILANPGTGVIIEGNYIHNVRGSESNTAGVRIDTCISCEIRNNLIHSVFQPTNYGAGTGEGQGILSYHAADALIENNEIHDVEIAVFHKNSAGGPLPDFNVRKNLIHDVHDGIMHDVQFGGAPAHEYQRVSQNILYNIDNRAVASTPRSSGSMNNKLDIWNNLFISDGMGIEVAKFADVNLYNNIIKLNSNGKIYYMANEGDYTTITESDYNNFDVVSFDFLYDRPNGNINAYSFSSWQTQSGFDQNSFTVDSDFVNENNRDYRLSSNSPLRNSGKNGDNIGPYLSDSDIIGLLDVHITKGNTGSGSDSDPNVYYVSKSGSDSNDCTTEANACLTIQKGISELSAGDTLNIGEGIYTDVGSSSSYFTGSACYYSSTPTGISDWLICMDRSGTSSNPIIIQSNPNNVGEVILDGGHIYQGTQTFIGGIHIKDNDFIHFKDITIRNVATNGIYNSDHTGDVFDTGDGSEGVLIEGLKIHHVGGGDNDAGIGMWSAKDWIVRNNEIYDIYGWPPASRGGNAVMSYGVVNALIEHNHFYNLGGGIYWKDHYVANSVTREPVFESEIRYNLIESSGNGVFLGTQPDNEAGENYVHHNIIRGITQSEASGIEFAMSSSSLPGPTTGLQRIENNLILGENSLDSAGITLSGVTNVEIEGNIISGFWRMILSRYLSSYDAEIDYSDYNIFVDYSSQLVLLDRYTSNVNAIGYSSLFTWQNALASESITLGYNNPDQNSIESSLNNLFNNYASNDFTYRTGSDAIQFMNDNTNAGPYQCGDEIIGIDLNNAGSNSDCDSGSPPQAPDPYWKLADGEFIPAKMPMHLVYPRPNGETNIHARHRYAHPNMPYEIPVGVQGGSWPFKYEIISGPSGATIGSEPRTDNYGIISWTPTVNSGSETFIVRITDQEYNTVDATWSVSIDASKFTFVEDGVSPGGDGSINNPLEDISDWYKFSDNDNTYHNQIIVFRSGNYEALGQASNNDNIRLDSDTKTRSLIGYPGEIPQFDMSNAKILTDTSQLTDLFISDIRFNNGDNSVGNAHFIWGVGDVTRSTFWRNHFNNIGRGTSGTDNPGAIYISAGEAVGGNDIFKDNIFVIDNLFTQINNDGSNGHYVNIYVSDYVLVEGNEARDSNSDYGFWMKGTHNYVTVRDNIAYDNVYDRQITFTNGQSESRGNPGLNEAAWNNLRTSSTGNSESFAISWKGQAEGSTYDNYIYRNTMHGPKNTIRFRGIEDYYLDGNVITNYGSTGLDYSIITNLIEPDLYEVGSDSFIDSTGKLIGTYRTQYLGTRGYELGTLMTDSGGTPPSDTQSPSVPGNLRSTSQTVDTINLAWDASTDNVGVSGYRIFRDGSQIGTTSSNTYIDSGLNSDTSYSYYVQAYDAAGNIRNSNTLSFSTLTSSSPNGLTITADSTYSGYDINNVNDVDLSTSWASTDDSVDHWLLFTYNEAQDISNVTVNWAYNDFRSIYMAPQNMQVQYWNGVNYVDIVTLSGDDSTQSSFISFSTINTDRLRFYLTQGNGNAQYNNIIWISEVEVGLGESNIPDPVCPNGVVENGEICDDGVNPSQLCQYGLISCQVCTNTCTYTSGITSYCGDNMCDVSNENINSCAQDCTPDPYCGDNNIDVGLGETCDGSNLNSQTCNSLGFEHGLPSCFAPGSQNACTFDTSGCYNDFPSIDLSYPNLDLSYGTDTTYLTVTTSEPSTCAYGLSDVSFDSMNEFDTTGGISHTEDIISLNSGSGNYTFYVRCRDSFTTPNENITTVTVTVSDPPESIPPIISSPSPAFETLAYGTSSTTVSVVTNESATCRYQLSPGVSYGNMPMANEFIPSSNGLSHELQNFVLSDDTSYEFYVKCIDQYDNANTDDFYFNFSVGSQAVIEDPVYNLSEILSYSPLNEIDVDTNPVRIEVNTRESAICRLSDTYNIFHSEYNLFDGDLVINGTNNYVDLDSTFFEKNKNNVVYVSCIPIAEYVLNNTLGNFSFNLGPIINTTNETQPPVNEVPDDTGSSSGGGGGSSSSSRNDDRLTILQDDVCKPDYTYPRWSTCLDGIQKRTITDDNGCENPRTESRICKVKNSELENKFLNAKKLIIEKIEDKKRTYRTILTSSYNEIISSDNKLDDETFVLVDEESGEEYLGRLVEENNDEYFYSLERIDENLIGELKAEGLVDSTTSEKIDRSFKDIFSSNYFKTGLFIFSLLLIIGFIYYVVIYIRKVHN